MKVIHLIICIESVFAFSLLVGKSSTLVRTLKNLVVSPYHSLCFYSYFQPQRINRCWVVLKISLKLFLLYSSIKIYHLWNYYSVIVQFNKYLNKSLKCKYISGGCWLWAHTKINWENIWNICAYIGVVGS